MLESISFSISLQQLGKSGLRLWTNPSAGASIRCRSLRRDISQVQLESGAQRTVVDRGRTPMHYLSDYCSDGGEPWILYGALRS
jgi:hypothetical protein